MTLVRPAMGPGTANGENPQADIRLVSVYSPGPAQKGSPPPEDAHSDEKSKGSGDDNMHSADVALRFSAVFAVAGFIIMAASLFEIDRREKSSSETVTANFTEIEQRVRMLSEQIRILNDQYTSQIDRNEQQLHSLDTEPATRLPPREPALSQSPASRYAPGPPGAYRATVRRLGGIGPRGVRVGA